MSYRMCVQNGDNIQQSVVYGEQDCVQRCIGCLSCFVEMAFSHLLPDSPCKMFCHADGCRCSFLLHAHSRGASSIMPLGDLRHRGFLDASLQITVSAEIE